MIVSAQDLLFLSPGFGPGALKVPRKGFRVSGFRGLMGFTRGGAYEGLTRGLRGYRVWGIGGL